MGEHGAMSAQEETELGRRTREWIQAEAVAHYGGDWGAAAAAILEAAYMREQRPDDRWAELVTRQRLRAGRA